MRPPGQGRPRAGGIRRTGTWTGVDVGNGSPTESRVFGSWRFIVVQTVIVTIWITLNLLAVGHRWDPYPFILLNLVFSTQAAYAAPLILLSQNRQADTDRITAEHDYRVNQLALQHLIAWHRDAHGPDCPCVRQVGSAAEGLLAELSRDL